MKSGKEKIYRLIQWLRKNRLVRWIRTKDVSIRYLILFIALIFFTIIWNIKNIYFDTFEVDENSARYLLSALLQSQAAIIAIVVTMTLVAVQLTASAYSPRVIDIFKNDRVMWMLLVWYGLSIFFGVFVLETIGSEHSNLNPWGITVSLEFYVFLAYLMGIVAFAGLFWHIGNVINLLKPKNIIEKLSEEITRENVLKFIEPEEKQKKGRTQLMKDDPVQPIVDIIHSSVMKYDIATTGYGLKSITEKTIKVVRSDCEVEISRHLCNHLERIGKLAVSREDYESVIKVLESLEFFGESTAEKELGGAAAEAAKSLRDVGIAAVEKGLEDAALQAALSIMDVGRAAVEKELGGAASRVAGYIKDFEIAAVEKGLEDAASQAAKSLWAVGIAAVEKGLEDAAVQAVGSLGDVGIAAVEKELGGAASEAAMYIKDFGIAAVEKELGGAASEAAMCIKDFGIAAVEKGLGDAAVQAVGSLGDVGIAAAEKGLEYVSSGAAWSLRDVGIAAVEKGLEDAAVQAVWSLGDVGIAAVEKELGGAASEAAMYIKDFGITAAEKGLENAVWWAVRALLDVGITAAEKGLEDAALQTAKSLAELTISSEEIVKTTIREMEERVEEQNHDVFDKFMNLYEQQLEELQTQKPDSDATTKP